MTEKTYPFPEDAPSVSISQSVTYRFRWKGFGWANFTVCDDTGEFSIQSNWGNFSYRWNADPRNLGAPTLTYFLARNFDCGYVIKKFAYQKSDETRDVFNLDATVAKMKKAVVEARKMDGRKEPGYTLRGLSREQARELWTDINYFEMGALNGGLDVAYTEASSRLHSFFDCVYSMAVWDKPYPYLICRDELLPRFFSYLRENVVPDWRQRKVS